MLKNVLSLIAFCSFALCSQIVAEETSSNDLIVELQKQPVLSGASAVEIKCPCSPRGGEQQRPRLAACEDDCHCDETSEDPENVLTKNDEALASLEENDGSDEDSNDNPIIVEVKKLLASCPTGKCPVTSGTVPVTQPAQTSEDPVDQDGEDQTKIA